MNRAQELLQYPVIFFHSSDPFAFCFLPYFVRVVGVDLKEGMGQEIAGNNRVDPLLRSNILHWTWTGELGIVGLFGLRLKAFLAWKMWKKAGCRR